MDSQQSPMAAKPTSRKPHRKTRTGCRTCKARKIKCDEQRPACTNCIKHSVQCDYLLTPASSSASPGAFPNNSNPYAAGTPRTSGDVGISLPHEPPILNMMDLELLHNFCTSTCMTLHNDPGLKTLWRINVPQLGFQYDFVMRGILAISALHMASWAPEEKKGYYLSQAFTQHQNGLRVATSILPNITDENCSALYIFSALTLFFTLAGPRDSTEFLIVGDSGTADWLILLKGVQSIIASAHPTLIRSSLGPMFLAGSRRDAIRETIYQQVSDEEDPLQELLSHLERAGYPENEYQLCVQAVNELRKSHATIRIQKPHEFESADIFIWFFRVEDDFVQLLREHHQGALAVFAHFCVLLKMIDYRWWVGSGATYHLSRVYRLLDAEHRLWIRWPIEEMGWIPDAADTPMESKDTLMMDTGSPHNASLPPS